MHLARVYNVEIPREQTLGASSLCTCTLVMSQTGHEKDSREDNSGSRCHHTFSVKRELREIVEPSRDGWLLPSVPRGG
jgi:hypothetical protein